MTFKEHFEVSNKAPLPVEPNKGTWLRLIPNIDLGHLLTMLTIGGVLVVQWNATDRRITIVEERTQQIMVTLADNRAIYNADSKERLTEVKDIKELITQLRTAVAITTYKIDQQGVPAIPRKQ